MTCEFPMPRRVPASGAGPNSPRAQVEPGTRTQRTDDHEAHPSVQHYYRKGEYSRRPLCDKEAGQACLDDAGSSGGEGPLVTS